MRGRKEIYDTLKLPIVIEDCKYDELTSLVIIELLLDIRDQNEKIIELLRHGGI